MTFYFYDLETSGISSKWQRITQFGGQRTDMDLNPVDDGYQTLVRLTDEILPEPDAVMVTGITPQKTVEEGISEVALANKLNKDVFKKDTISVGYNTIRFDDEFVRSLFFRNYFDPYEREWSEGRSRWDIIDVVRMTRALRPEGIKWPTTEEGKPTNRLEDMTKANDLEHSNAHDALSDVQATIDLARLVKKAQPKLFAHLLSLRDKKVAGQLVDPNNPQPIVHTSGKLRSDNLKTSVFIPLARHPVNSNAILAWDLRFDPKDWQEADEDELARLAFTHWTELAKNDEQRLPVKAIHLNKSPAVAPIGVLDEDSQKRINLTLSQIEAHIASLNKMDGLSDRIAAAWDKDQPSTEADVDGQLYSGFITDMDKKQLHEIHRLKESDLVEYRPDFKDNRLNDLWIRYKARNFPKTLTDSERSLWEQYRAERLSKGPGVTLAQYMNRLKQLAQENSSNSDKMYLLEELQLYAESIVPFENESLFSS